jgi:hypothetical protein
MKILYQGLMGITRAVVRHADATLARGVLPAAGLPATIELVRHILAQTRARVLRGDTHFPGKVVSVFEPHTEIIRKGKLAKPTEFGRLVKIQEAEGQFITDYEVCEKGQAERALWAPTLDRHIALFGRAPQLAVADGGFASRANERAAQERGVRHVVLPRQSREARSRAARAALRWRTGSERTHQRPQTSARDAAVPVSRSKRDATVGRAGRDRQRSARPRPSGTMTTTPHLGPGHQASGMR